MKKLLQKIRLRVFPPVSKSKALEIARKEVFPELDSFDVYDRKWERAIIYNMPDEPCWFVHAPWNDGMLMLRSSRIMLVSKLTGKVLYDGSACDEG